MTLKPQLDDLLEIRHQARALGIASHHLVNSALTGLYASVFRGQGLDFSEVREYREGDDIRNMDWRVTARTGTPHLKVYQEEHERSVMLCVDQGPHMSFGTRGTFKSIQAARTAALLGWSASNYQEHVGSLLFGDPKNKLRHFRPTRGRRALWRTLHALSDIHEHGSCDDTLLPDVLQRVGKGLPSGSLIFLIASLNTDPSSLEHPLGSLRLRHNVVLLPVDDPADYHLEAMGQVLFQSADGEVLEIDTDNTEAAAFYHQQWHQRRQALRSICNKLGITILPVSTDEDVHHTLIHSLRQRAAGRHVS